MLLVTLALGAIITPSPRHMFCALSRRHDVFYSIAGIRPPKSLTMSVYNSSLDVVWRGDVPTNLWEDPRLLLRPDGQYLATFQRMGRPIGVAIMRTDPYPTLSNIQTLHLKGVEDQSTKNWMPFYYNNILHFVICPLPLIIVRCDQTCVPIHNKEYVTEKWGQRQNHLVLRGGTQLEYVDGVYVGMLHSTTGCKGASFHRTYIIKIKPAWEVVYLGIVDVPNPFSSPVSHFIHDPVSIVDVYNTSIRATFNVGDEKGGCVLATVPIPPPVTETEVYDYIHDACNAVHL